jgi:hypothetical protein
MDPGDDDERRLQPAAIANRKNAAGRKPASATPNVEGRKSNADRQFVA